MKSRIKLGSKHLGKSFALGLMVVVLAVSVAAVTQIGKYDIGGRAASGPNPKILLLGDSLIASTDVPTFLFTILKNAGIPVNFIGDKVVGKNHVPVDGFSGFTTTMMLQQLESGTWTETPPMGGTMYPNTFKAHVPDIVIIQLGTNDVRMYSDPVSEYEGNMEVMIHFLRQNNLRMKIVIPMLTPSRDETADARIKRINAAIPSFVQSMSSPNSPVVTTQDLRSVWKPEDFVDNFHPSASGSEKIGQSYYNALVGNGFVSN